MPRKSDPTDAGFDNDAGPVPPANEPGHHPEVEQDKPLGRRPRPQTRATPASTRRFAFRFAGPAGVAATPFTVGRRAHVDVADGQLTVHYGPWTLTSPLDNVADAFVTGPYQLWKVAGPPHLSLFDRGITFATTTERGVCIRFKQPVAGIEPTGQLRHRGATVTVDDPDALVQALTAD